MTTRVPTPFGQAPSTGAVPGYLQATSGMPVMADANGLPVANIAVGMARKATAPTHTPGAGDAGVIWCEADSKIYVWTTGTTWLKTGALT